MELEQYKIYVLDGSTCTEFRPGNPIVLSEFVYSAQRMGTATLTATVRDAQCLDSLWTGKEFVCLDESSLSGSSAIAGSLEKFFLLHTPSSSKSSEDERYVHTLEFVSERDITLSSVYFLDAVPNTSTHVPDKYRSNQFQFSFYGTLSEFVGRFNSVLALRGLSSRFHVVLDCTSIVAGGNEYLFAGPVSGVYKWTREVGNTTYAVYSASSSLTTESRVYQNTSLTGTGISVSAVTLPSDEVKEMTFDKRTLFEACQDAFSVYGVPFWFEGDVIHFGEGSTVVPEVVFEYGADEELLSISKNNTNAKIVTRITGVGGDTNIPYYYPNPTPKGTLGVGGTATGVSVVNQLRFAERIDIGETVTYYKDAFLFQQTGIVVGSTTYSGVNMAAISPFYAYTQDGSLRPTTGKNFVVNCDFKFHAVIQEDQAAGSQYIVTVTPTFINSRSETCAYWPYEKLPSRNDTVRKLETDGIYFSPTGASATKGGVSYPISFSVLTERRVSRGGSAPDAINPASWKLVFSGLEHGEYDVTFGGYVTSSGIDPAMYDPNHTQGQMTTTVMVSYTKETRGGWVSGSHVWYENLSDIGLSMSGTPSTGDTITQIVASKIPPQQNLMPSVYRSSNGNDRWYNAIDDHYSKPEGGYYDYKNEYDPLSPREYIQDFEDIYPTIRNLVDGSNNPLNVFADVYFETGYNTHDTITDGENTYRKYTYFLAKLKPLGFNIFDCAIDSGAMTFEMIDGHCAGCKFVLLVDNTDQNDVQVTGSGSSVALVTDNDGRVVLGTPQAQQNDTTSNYVWVRLAVDTSTYGDDDEAVMPGDTIRPAASDPYVITNIALPQSYYIAAEEKLKHALLEFMAENNAEKYKYSVKFSRIYLAHNHSVRDALNEHAALNLRYAGQDLSVPLHVQQYTVRQQEGEALPEVDVELTDEIEDAPGGLSDAISASVENIVNVVYGGGTGGGMSTAMGDSRYLRRDRAETVAFPMTFQKGLQTDGFVEGLSGAALSVGDDGKTALEVDRLVVRDGTVLPSTTSTGGGDSLLEIVEYDETNHKYAAHLKLQAYLGTELVDLDGIYTDGFMSAGGLNANAGGGGGGGVENLWALSDVYHSTAVLRAGGAQSVQPGDILSYGAGTNNQQWYARPVDTTPTLNSTGLITSGAVYSELALKQASIDAIEALIPSEATSSNQLADKAFVNSSIATNTGSLITDNGDAWSSLSDLQNYSGSVSTNDYAFVVTTDQLGNTTYNRYKYDGTQWVFEYALNNSSFTAAQWDAINSGITGSLVARIVNPDWNQTTSTAADYIKNKPSFTNAGATLTAGQTVTIATMAGTNVTVTVPSFALASSVPAAQIQSDWNQTNNSALDFIKNKPTSWALADITGADDLKLIEALDGSGLLRRTKSGNNVSWSLDSSTYLTANQTITLTGDVTGSGTTSIATTIGTGKVTNAMLAGSIENSKLNTIGVTKGGTGLTSISKGAILYASASNTIAALSANGTNTKKYLTQTSNNAPAWGTIQSADLPDLSGTYKTVDSLKSKGSATLPVYFDSNGAAQTITGLVVSGNIQTTGGTLSVSGATTLGSTLSVAGALTLSTTKKIYFGDSRYYLELVNIAESGDPEWAFHFSHGVYSDGFVSGGGLNSDAGSGGGGSIDAYTKAETDAAIAAANFFVVNEYDTGYYEAKLKSAILDGADTRALDGISAPKVATEEIDDPNAQLRIMDGDGHVVAKVSSDGVQATSVEGKKVVTPRYRTDDEDGFEILEDSFPGIVIADENGYVLERIRAGHGFYGSVKDKIIKQRNKPALSWIDDDFAILDNGSLLTVYSKLHTWCNSNGIYLDFASGIQTEDALTYMLNWEKEGFRYLLHPDHDGWWTGAGGYVHDITKVRSSLVETIRFFKSTGLCSSAKILVWPGSSNSVSDNLPVVQKYCECAISVLQGGNPAAINDRYQIRRIKIDEISSTKTKAYYKNWISQCLLNNEWVILYTHLYDVSSADTVDNTSNTFGNVMDIVSYANSLSRLRSTEEIWEERKLMYDF